MDQNWMAVWQQKQQLARVIETNRMTAQYGLTLNEAQAGLLAAEQCAVLKEQRRLEFGEGIIPRMIAEFCDSDFIDQEHYVEILLRLQEIFYLYKNEMQDEISDEELLHFMKEQFEMVCFGDLEYLEGTCLTIFAQAIRAGYRGYQATAGRGEYAALDEVQRWDYELYLQALDQLFGQ